MQELTTPNAHHVTLRLLRALNATIVVLTTLAVLFALAATPTASAGDGTDTASLYIDTWEISGTYYVNMTIHLTTGWTSPGCATPSPIIQMYGHKANDNGDPAIVIGSGGVTRIGTSNAGYRNVTVTNLNFDSIALKVTWQRGVTCGTTIADTAVYRSSDFYVSNDGQCDQNGCVGNDWYNATVTDKIEMRIAGHEYSRDTWDVLGLYAYWGALIPVVLAGIGSAKSGSVLVKTTAVLGFLGFAVAVALLDPPLDAELAQKIVVVASAAWALIVGFSMFGGR